MAEEAEVTTAKAKAEVTAEQLAKAEKEKRNIIKNLLSSEAFSKGLLSLEDIARSFEMEIEEVEGIYQEMK